MRPQFDHRRSPRFQAWNLVIGLSTGGTAMWIVFYIATIASLSALGLAPNVLPEETDEEPEV